MAALSDDTLAAIVAMARKLLQANVTGTCGGIVTDTPFRRTTRRADPGGRLWVYGRRAAPCRKCGTPISYRKQGKDARGTYWCPQCQRSLVI